MVPLLSLGELLSHVSKRKNEVNKVDIEIYQNGAYVNTFFDVADSEHKLFEFLCDFCSEEGYSIGDIESDAISECALALFSGDEISLCGFDFKRCD